MNFQDIILKLDEYWAKQGCIIQQPYDIEVGAGTFNPATFMRVLGPEPWRVAYVEPSRRPTDGRYGDNPWRAGHYYQYQVILKPSPPDIQNIYLQSLEYLGIDLSKHDIRFVEDDWESPTLGASGLGWEVWMDSSEITQYTYFQQMGSIDLDPISVEITYGLERIAMNSQDVDSIFDIEWAYGITYGDVHYRSEVEYSTYYLDEADTAMLFMLFDTYEKEAFHCLDKGLILPGVDYVLKCSHTFNVLDARGSISVTERASYIARVRNLARRCAQGYCKQREDMGYPLMKNWKPNQTIHSTQDIKYSIPTESHLDFLLEIGTEEIPASYIQPALDQIESSIKNILTQNRIEFGDVQVIGTPRRMTAYVTKVATNQPDRVVEVMGPPKRAAFDDSGNPTKAGEGFARKYGMNADDLKIKSTDKGEYVYLLVAEKGRLTAEVLADELPQLISSIDFPKSMHFSSFEDGKFQFARPLRWIVSLLGEEVIKFNVGRVVSDRYTYGHRFLSSGAIEIKSASFDDYKKTLRDAGVIVDHNERRELIKQQVSDILKSEGSTDYIDEEILETVTFLVEMPKPVVGSFSESYLTVPVEVLETAMKKHQKYFSLHRKDDGKYGSPLLPKFITITNGAGDESVIRHGNERVLRSRLDDAQFFYNEDQKTGFAQKLDKLNHVVFQEELGTLYDKSQRLKELAGFLCDELGLDEEVGKNAIRASELCKIDLVTQMVGEFPTLQGIMGGYYAINSGENEEVAKAIRSHYKPNSPTDDLPDTIISCIVSIADKLDTIVGYFATGNIPTGSQDPYALRRQATGIVRIAIEKELKLNLDNAITKSIELYNQRSKIKIDDPKLANIVAEFLKGRISAILSDKGFSYDVIDSVLSVGETNAIKILKRANVLANFKNRNDFDRIYPALNRVLRILPNRELIKTGNSFKVDTNLFQDKYESDLYESVIGIENDVRKSSEDDDYGDVINRIATLCDNIDLFFDNVMVMVEQEELKNNRLAILYRIAGMIYLVADISKLVV